METDWLGLYLDEDLGTGDVTSAVLGHAEGRALMVLREPAVVAGLAHSVDVFDRRGAQAKALTTEGTDADAGTVLLEVQGPARAILEAERVALNIVGRMSGIATMTRRLMEALAKDCSAALVAGTRKTTPGFRAFEKEAIRIGGGDPHRMGLWDEAMVKDNHIAAAGGIEAAVSGVRAAHPKLVITAEAESLHDALAAAAAGADWVMIDNQPSEVGRAWAEAVWQKHPHVKIEASGGIDPSNVLAYGWADRISLGALTHQARSVDVGMDWAMDGEGDH